MRLKILFFLTVFAAGTAFTADEYSSIIIRAGESETADYTNALRLYGTAIEIQPSNPAAYLKRGILQYSHYDYISSSSDFRKTVNLETNFNQKLSDIEKINEITCTKFNGNTSEENSKNMMRLIKSGNSREAIPELETLSASNGQNAYIFYQLGYAYNEVKDFNKAVYYLEKGRIINPVYENILLELKYAYSELKNLNKLEEIINDMMSFFGENPELYQDLGFAFAENGNFNKAALVFEKSEKEFPDYSITGFILGQIYFQTGKNELSKYYLNKFMEEANQGNFDKYGIRDDLKSYKSRAEKMLESLK